MAVMYENLSQVFQFNFLLIQTKTTKTIIFCFRTVGLPSGLPNVDVGRYFFHVRTDNITVCI